MRFKTRKKRDVFISVLNLESLGEVQKDELCSRLLNFSKKNTQEITYPYLLKRLKNYGILTLATSGEEIVGFGFADQRTLALGIKIPLIHFGLMIIDTDWRGDRLSRLISLFTTKHVIKKIGLKCYFTGFAISAKCSSPVSFYRLQQASLRVGFPKLNKRGELHPLSKTRVGKALSLSLSSALELGEICDFIIQDSNTESGFKLSKDEYITNTPYEKSVLTFFQKKVMPHNEVLFISFAHPVMAL